MRNKPNPNRKSLDGIKTNILWHRRIGLSTFVVLIFLAISGFALNHSPGLKLNQINLTSSWLLSWYGFELPAAEGFEIGEKWFYQDGNKALMLDGDNVAPCSAPLRSVAQTSDGFFALCADGLNLLTSEGQFVEQFGSIDGLPNSTKTLSTINNKLYLVADSETMAFNASTLELRAAKVDHESLKNNQQMAVPLPKRLQKDLAERLSGPSISLETVILDLHSGRFFGQFGVLFVDLIGLLVCILSITGLMAWLKRR